MSEREKKIEQRLERMQVMRKIIEEKFPNFQYYVSEMLKDDIRLSWDDLVELAIRFANEKDEEFFEFIKANYETILKTPKARYIPPAATIVSTERQEACVAAVLGIGIGWIWAWLAVSPWAVTTEKSV